MSYGSFLQGSDSAYGYAAFILILLQTYLPSLSVREASVDGPDDFQMVVLILIDVRRLGR